MSQMTMSQMSREFENKNCFKKVKRMVSRWALDQFSNTVWTLQWRCLTRWRFTMLCAHQRPYTGCAHRHFPHHRKQTHFWESNLRHLRLAGVPVEMLAHYTNPPHMHKVIGGNSGRSLTPDTSTSVACSFSSEQPCSCKLAASGLVVIH